LKTPKVPEATFLSVVNRYARYALVGSFMSPSTKYKPASPILNVSAVDFAVDGAEVEPRTMFFR